jgi:hypothetical protein
MLKFLFWNTNKKPLEILVAAIVFRRGVDIVLLAECQDPLKVLSELNRSYPSNYLYLPSLTGSRPVHLFSRLPGKCIESRGDYGGLSFLELNPLVGKTILLVTAHLSSKLWMEGLDQALECTNLIRKIQQFESILGHRRTVVVGDFNINPFEAGLTAAHCFHAAQSRYIARRKHREFHGETYPYFYNPMWSHFGDRGPSPPGTYFRNASSPTEVFWNMFDQVLIRPDLLENFMDESLEIVTCAGDTTLLCDDGRPDKNRASDHLPILFGLNLLEGYNDDQEPMG